MKKILYIEDNKAKAKSVKGMLLNNGFKTEVAFLGKDGIKKANKHHFDLILLNATLPDMCGWEIFQTLKKKIKGVKYMILTVIPLSRERIKALKKAGISDSISNPFIKKDLIAKINKVLK